MARIKDPNPSVRVRIEGNLKRGVDPAVDTLLDWLEEQPKRRRFQNVIRRLLMGGVLETVVEDGDLVAARNAAAQIIGAFVVDDDE